MTESGVNCSASLSGGVAEYSYDSVNEVSYARVKLICCLFQDDISRMAESLRAEEEENSRLKTIAEKRIL